MTIPLKLVYYLYSFTLFSPSMDYNLDAMKRHSRCYVPDGDAGGSVATGRATLASKVDGKFYKVQFKSSSTFQIARFLVAPSISR